MFNFKQFIIKATIIFMSISNIYGIYGEANPPVAKKIIHEFTIHNKTIVDEYNWLRDKKWPSSVEDKNIIDYLNQENSYADEVFFSKNKELKNKLFEELKSRIKLTDQSLYIKKGNYFYYTKTLESKDYPIFCRKHESISAPEEIYLDQNEIARGKKFASISTISISEDNKLLAYGVDFNGSESYTIKILNLETKKYLSDEIPNTSNNIVWDSRGQGFFYTPLDQNLRHNKVFYHKLGDKRENDILIFTEQENTYHVSISKSSSKRFLFVEIGGYKNNEIRFIDLENVSNFDLITVQAREKELHYDVYHSENSFYILTNDKGINFRVAIVDISNPGKKYWRKFIDQDKVMFLGGIDVTKNYIILDYTKNGLPFIQIAKISNINTKNTLNFDDESYEANAYSVNYHDDEIRINYSSLKKPDTTYSYDYLSNKLTALKTKEIPSGFNSDEYDVKRLFASYMDVKVPITLVYKKSLFKNDGSNFLYIMGYGSYGISMPVGFRSNIVSLLDRGFVFAIAHIRGGKDLGYDWYKGGKFLKKKNTFEDFIACTEYLVKEKFTSKGKIAAIGGSAGGMLMGYIANKRPDLYKGIIAHVPFVDVLNTMLDATLPLTPGEYNEWGNPEESKRFFDYIRTYSPYDNVKNQSYPNMFVTTGVSDPRVGYFEAAKWVAKIRNRKTDDNLIVFKTNMDSGHSGSSGRFEYLKEVADDYVFLMNIFEIEKPK